MKFEIYKETLRVHDSMMAFQGGYERQLIVATSLFTKRAT